MCGRARENKVLSSGDASLIGAIEVAVPEMKLGGKVRKTPSWPRSWANFSLF